jgi:hypothetical protein
MPYRHFLIAVLIFLGVPCLVGLRAAEPADISKAAQEQQIAKLVRQLGHDKFEEREAATKALAQVGCPALESLRRAAAMDKEVEVRHRAADLVDKIENSLAQLLIDYRQFGLPLPPENALLVRFSKSHRHLIFLRVGNKHGWATLIMAREGYRLAFVVETAKEETSESLPLKKEIWLTIHWGAVDTLHGAETQLIEKGDVEFDFDAQQLTAKDLEPYGFNSSEALALAVQMQARGWKQSAQAVLEKGFQGHDVHSPHTALRFLAWNYWNDRLFDETTNRWAEACRQMKALLADEPALDTPENRSLFKSLELALVPSKAKPGSVESLIDDLMNARRSHYSDTSDECLRNVLDRGFDAVPELLEHLEDDRLTRYLRPDVWVNRQFEEPAYHFRVCDLADALLRMLAGKEATAGWPSAQKDRAAAKRQSVAWWNEARKEGEEAYLVSHALPANLNEDDESPYDPQLRLLSKKYPRRLAAVYREVLTNRPNMATDLMIHFLVKSTLSREEKMDLLVLAAGNRSFKHRYAALSALKKLDEERFLVLLTRSLDDLPITPNVRYHRCVEKDFVNLACETDDSRVVRALDSAVKRADPGLRLEMLNCRPRSSLPATERRLLRLLVAFLDDATVRDTKVNSEKYENVSAGFWFQQLEVRNFAALRIAGILEKKERPQFEWSAEQWSKFRAKMRLAAKMRLVRQHDEQVLHSIWIDQHGFHHSR